MVCYCSSASGPKGLASGQANGETDPFQQHLDLVTYLSALITGREGLEVLDILHKLGQAENLRQAGVSTSTRGQRREAAAS